MRRRKAMGVPQPSIEDHAGMPRRSVNHRSQLRSPEFTHCVMRAAKSQPDARGPTGTRDGVGPQARAIVQRAVTSPGLAARDPKPDNFAGTKRFAVVRRLGHGGAGIVYEANDREQGVRVALKRLRRLSPEAILRFKSEFRSVEDVEHPNLVALGELFEESGQWFFTMEYVDGIDLLAWVRRPARAGSVGDATESDGTQQDGSSSGSLRHRTNAGAKSFDPTKPAFDEERLRSGMAQLLRALEALHAAGKVHRDVKPSNALATPEGRIVLLDFGLATDVVREARDIRAEGIVGTVSYMAPEQALGLAVDARADMYSVGVVLYRALTGRLPFEKLPEPGEALIPPRPMNIAAGVPDDLDALCMDLLRRSPELRPTAAEALRRLGLSGQDAGAAPTLASIAPPAPKRFVGRRTELAMLREAFDETLRGECVVVAVTGESGLGKSTLVRRFGEIVSAEYNAVVLSGRCWERESVPFKAVDGIIDALARWLSRASRDDVEQILPPNSALLAQVFPSLRPLVDGIADLLGGGSGVPSSRPSIALSARVTEPSPSRASAGEIRSARPTLDMSPGPSSGGMIPASLRGPGSNRAPVDAREQRVQLFAAARALFGNLTQRLPVVLVVDDLQWSDADGLALLREVVRVPEAPSLLLVATVRATAKAGESELVERIRDDARALAVEPLDGEDARALALDVLSPSAGDRGMRASRPDTWDDTSSAGRIASLADAIAREAHGHPLFVDALARAALASSRGGGPALDSPRGTAPAVRLEQVLVNRVDRLDPAARRVVEFASVAGSPLRLDVLSRAAEAAAESLPRVVRGLQIARLVRTRGEGRTRTVEPYHDRVRDAVLGRLELAERRRIHLGIGLAMEELGHDDADALVAHFTAAGDEARAFRWTERAASNAMRALAFSRAATLLRSLLANPRLEPRAARTLNARLGEALVAGGRGAEAADAFLAAAKGAEETLAFELQRRAAEQLLTSGHLERGLATLAPVLESVRVDAPTSRLGAAASLAWGRAKLAARGLSFRERAERDVPAEQLRRVDAMSAAAAALGMVDTIRGADLQTRHLLAALEAGEPRRLARAIALEAPFSATQGTEKSARTAAVLELATQLCGRFEDPLAAAQVLSASGASAFLEGRFREARDLLSAADMRLRGECSGAGVAFQLVNANLYLLGAMLHTGDVAGLGRRLPALLDDAEMRGDRYALTHLRTSIGAFIELARDEPAQARREAQAGIDAWTAEGTHMPHFFDVLAQAQIDLYEDDAARAVDRTEKAFSALRRAMLLRVQFVRVKMRELRARTMIAAATASGAHPTARSLSAFDREVAELRTENAPWASALADLLRAAGLAALEDPHAVAAFERAVAALDDVGLALHAAVARVRLGAVHGAGAAAMREAEAGTAWLLGQGVRAPARFVAMLSPGGRK